MIRPETQDSIPPPGYPTENPPMTKKRWFQTKKRGEQGFLEGCLLPKIQKLQFARIFQPGFRVLLLHLGMIILESEANHPWH
ncbi:hypothetical protein AKJ16_DCAP08826 [Drosera capensis]